LAAGGGASAGSGGTARGEAGAAAMTISWMITAGFAFVVISVIHFIVLSIALHSLPMGLSDKLHRPIGVLSFLLAPTIFTDACVPIWIVIVFLWFVAAIWQAIRSAFR
jgi:hypothetical protein